MCVYVCVCVYVCSYLFEVGELPVFGCSIREWTSNDEWYLFLAVFFVCDDGVVRVSGLNHWRVTVVELSDSDTKDSRFFVFRYERERSMIRVYDDALFVSDDLGSNGDFMMVVLL